MKKDRSSIKEKKISKQLIRGFTLVELLVVISIISLLSSVIFAGLNSARAKARDARRLRDINEIYKATILFEYDNGFYPLSNLGETYPFTLNDGVVVNGVAAYSTDVSPSPATIPGVLFWQDPNLVAQNDLESQLKPYLAPLSKDPINTFPTPQHEYQYFASLDPATNNPLTVYWDSTTIGHPAGVCGWYSTSPGIPLRGMVSIAGLEVMDGNRDEIFGTCKDVGDLKMFILILP